MASDNTATAALADMVVVEPPMRDPRTLAILRMTVFRNWPYLYDGSMAYEMEYLCEFLGDPAAVMIVARVSDIVIGLATASPLSGQPRSISEPLVEAGFDTASTFYFGESVLLPQSGARALAIRSLTIARQRLDQREPPLRPPVRWCAKTTMQLSHPTRAI